MHTVYSAGNTLPGNTKKYGLQAEVSDWPCNRQRSRDMQYIGMFSSQKLTDFSGSESGTIAAGRSFRTGYLALWYSAKIRRNAFELL